jgi:hypothetical protein
MKKVILAAAISFSILSCKKEASIAYKYADKPVVLNCENLDEKLVNEAYYAFENAILIHAKNTNKRPNIPVTSERALQNFIKRSSGFINITEYTTKEGYELFNSLKNLDIWDGAQLKSNATVTECIGESIANPNIKSSFNSLRSVESLTPKLMGSSIINNRTRDLYKDKALMTYVAFDMYYAKFFNTDFSAVTFLTEKENTVAPSKPVISPKNPEIGKALNLDLKKKTPETHSAHDGHNH